MRIKEVREGFKGSRGKGFRLRVEIPVWAGSGIGGQGVLRLLGMTVRSEIGGLTSAAEAALSCDGIAALKGCAAHLAGEQGFRVSGFTG